MSQLFRVMAYRDGRMRTEAFDVPWELVAPHEQQAKRNHQQTLARLNQRGGLDPIELRAVMEGKPWPTLFHLTQEEAFQLAQEAVAWIKARSLEVTRG